MVVSEVLLSRCMAVTRLEGKRAYEKGCGNFEGVEKIY